MYDVWFMDETCFIIIIKKRGVRYARIDKDRQTASVTQKRKRFNRRKTCGNPECFATSDIKMGKWQMPSGNIIITGVGKSAGLQFDTLLIPSGSEYRTENTEKVKNFYFNYNENDRLESQTTDFIRSKQIISRYLFDNKIEIADVGGGTGPYSFWLAEKGHNVHLLDVTPKHIEIAKQKGKTNKISLSSYTCGDARELPYENESMDMVLLMGPLYHFQSQESRAKCLTEAFRILKNGGHVICTVINRYTILVSTIKWNIFNMYDTDTLDKVIKPEC
jgi:ubiquinone/menaquinone biosynthesis C-methylase UbiE